MKTYIKKSISILVVLLMLTVHTVPATYAIDAPVAPSAPTAPTAPVAPSAPTAPTAPTYQDVVNDQQTTTDTEEANEDTQVDEVEEATTTPTTPTVTPTPSPKVSALITPTPTTTQAAPSGQVGDSEIDTGDAVSSGVITTNGNNNASSSTADTGVGTGASVINSGNGADSNNSGSATVDTSDNTFQNNAAVINNNLTGASVTGANDTSKNVGNSSIKTGDANTTGTVITAVNTNADGIMVSEFNVVDDHIGDIVLDFGSACISGCGGTGSLFAGNTGNGADSTNDASTDMSSTSNTFQTNDALIGNDLVLSADSGNNTASKNTGGDSSITTGDANVAANVLTLANNNIAGNIIYGVVNIFGDLVGDLIFSEDQFAAMGTTATNSGNGSNSTNTANTSTEYNDNTFQNNDANITNNLIFDAETGSNDASGNTGGSSEITTGDTSIDANVLNIANSNMAGGNWWIVLVNEAGNWMGKIMGQPEGATFAGSQGSDFSVDENGFITVSNNANGSGSTNDASTSQSTTNNLVQSNNADIVNNLNLSANTGNNETSKNTGGNSNITTGDANIIANLVNFVNNNISGNGKLIVSVVNVFGSWMGDFVTPGQKKADKPVAQITDNTQESDNKPLGGTTTSQENNEQSVTQTVPVTPTPTIVQNGNSTLAIAARGDGTSVAGMTTERKLTSKATESQVKGASYSVADAAAEKNIVKINLAWTLLVLPVVLALFLKKRLLVRKQTA